MCQTNSPAEAAYTLRFTEWRCGHHGQRPADIPVSSPEQAKIILQAISHAISQPGHARAVLYCSSVGTSIYLTDDYVEPIAQQSGWIWRTVVYHGSTEEIEELRSLQPALEECYGGTMNIWDGQGCLDEHMEVVTTLSAQAIEEACAPIEWHEEGTRREVCTIPPEIKPAALLLAELREYQADAGAIEEEGGAA